MSKNRKINPNLVSTGHLRKLVAGFKLIRSRLGVHPVGYKSVPKTHIVRKSTPSLTKIILSFGVYEANIAQITVQPLKISKTRYTL